MPATRTDKVIKQNRPYRLQTTTALMSLMKKEVEATSNEEVAEEVRRNADIAGIRKGRHLARWVRTYLKEKSKLGLIDSDVELASFKITHKGHQQFQEIGKHIPAGLNELDWIIACLKEAKIHLGPFTRDEYSIKSQRWEQEKRCLQNEVQFLTSTPRSGLVQPDAPLPGPTPLAGSNSLPCYPSPVSIPRRRAHPYARPSPPPTPTPRARGSSATLIDALRSFSSRPSSPPHEPSDANTGLALLQAERDELHRQVTELQDQIRQASDLDSKKQKEIDGLKERLDEVEERERRLREWMAQGPQILQKQTKD